MIKRYIQPNIQQHTKPRVTSQSGRDNAQSSMRTFWTHLRFVLEGVAQR